MINKTALLSMLESESDIVIPLYKSIEGHPVLIKSTLKNKILDFEYTNLRDFIKNQNIRYINTDDIGIITDIDTPDDYIKLRYLITERDYPY